MIDPAEIRIGNYYRFKHATVRVDMHYKALDRLELYDDITISKIFICGYDEIEPVQLKDDWFRIFRLVKDSECLVWRFLDEALNEYKIEFKDQSCGFVVTNGKGFEKKLSAVHELQNFYAEHTGKEIDLSTS